MLRRLTERTDLRVERLADCIPSDLVDGILCFGCISAAIRALVVAQAAKEGLQDGSRRRGLVRLLVVRHDAGSIDILPSSLLISPIPSHQIVRSAQATPS